MKLNTDVRVDGIEPELVLALMVADSAFQECSEEMVVTAIDPSAVHLRLPHRDGINRATLRAKVRSKLPKEYSIRILADDLIVSWNGG